MLRSFVIFICHLVLALLLVLFLIAPVEASLDESKWGGLAQAVFRKFVAPPASSINDDDLAIATPPQPMKVIGAGLGRTGTSSFVRALGLLGLKSYHFQEGMVDTPGHIDLFRQHATSVAKGEAGISDRIIEGISTAGFNATADYPTCLLYRELMETYPDALVVLTVRSSKLKSSQSGEGPEGVGLSWAKSMETVLKISHVQGKRLPWRLLPTMRKLSPVADWYLPNVPWDPITKLPKRDAMAKAYEAYVQQVINTVPPEKLLVFAPTDGWEPLCHFLSPVDDIVKTNCEKLLDSGTPYPRVNDKEEVKKAEEFFWRVATAFESILGLVGVLCIWWVYSRCIRGTTERAKQD